MKIGNVEFGKEPLFLAPMEDVTDPAFRLLCKRFGADMVYTEFVSADALLRSAKPRNIFDCKSLCGIPSCAVAPAPMNKMVSG